MNGAAMTKVWTTAELLKAADTVKAAYEQERAEQVRADQGRGRRELARLEVKIARGHVNLTGFRERLAGRLLGGAS